MKGWLIKVLLLAAVLSPLSGCDDADRLLLSDGRYVPFSHWSNRWLIINYWAEWCAPCRKEIPELNRLHAERASSGVVVLGVNYDGLTGDKLTTLAKEMGIEFPVLVEDPRQRWGVAPPAGLPSTLHIGPHGQLADVLVGPHHYEDFARVSGLVNGIDRP
ncbi:MAG: TlpA disulfide reductase family protein [Gammaproteobacteria bacterium]